MKAKSRTSLVLTLLFLTGLFFHLNERVTTTVGDPTPQSGTADTVSKGMERDVRGTGGTGMETVQRNEQASDQSLQAYFAARDLREPTPFVLRPIEEYPVLTAADREDMEGVPAPVIPRGRHARRILDAPVSREIRRDRDEPLRPFGPARAARPGSPFAHDHYSRSAVEVALSNRMFHEAAEGAYHLMEVPITDEESVTVELDQILVRGAHTFSFIGKVAEHRDSVVILVYNEGTVSGGISLYGTDAWDGRHYEFMAMEEGLVAVRELDPLAYQKQECGTCGETHGEALSHDMEDPPEPGEEQTSSGDSAAEPVDHIVDIVVGYGKDARVAEGGTAAIEGRILASVERMNITFANSLVTNTQLVLLGMIEDPDYVFKGWETGTMLDEVNALAFVGNGRLDVVGQLRLDLGADLNAFIIRDSDGDAGRAYRPGVASVTARTYMTNTRVTFVHELGHNFGLYHAWGDSTGDNVKTNHAYGWRYRDGSTRRRTVMAYDWGWERTMYFANPQVIHPVLNARTGAVNGYNATGDGTTDTRFVSGGYASGLGAGFDGTNPSLGARAADFLTANAFSRESQRTRASLTLLAPASGAQVEIGQATLIEWVGGAYEDLYTLELLKGGAVIAELAQNQPNHNRVLSWTPAGLARGNDYQLRISLNAGQEVHTTGQFTIDPLYPRVVDTFVDPTGVAVPGLQSVSVTFSRGMDPASFSLAQDVTRFFGPGGTDLLSTISSADWSADHTVLTFQFTPLAAEGYYRLDLGPDILDTRGYAMDQNDNAVPGEAEDGYGFSFRVADAQAGGTLTILAQAFDSGHNFQLDTGWAVGPPAQTGVGGPGSAPSPQNVLGTYLSGNYASGVNISATSPSFSTVNAENVTISFRRWLGLAAVTSGGPSGRFQDSALLEYSIQQGAWQTLWSNTEGVLNDGGWQLLAYTLPSAVNNQSDVRIRFRLQTQSANSYGWNLDDLVIAGDFASTLGPAPAPVVAGHFPAGAVIVSPTSMWFDFDQPMDTASFSLGDIASFVGPAGAVTAAGFAWEADNRLRVDFPAVGQDGLYTMTLGTGILNVEGTALSNTYAGSFDLGTFDPPVILTENLPVGEVSVAYSAGVAADSAAGLPLTLSVAGRPAWLGFTDHGNGTGTLSGTAPFGSAGIFPLTLSAFDGASTTQRSLSLEIKNRPHIGFSEGGLDVSENAGAVILTVQRSLQSEGSVSVNYATVNGTAVGGTDFISTSGTLTWGDGDVSNRTVSVTIQDDTLTQGDREFLVRLSNLSSNADMGIHETVVAIIDDDANTPPQITMHDPVRSPVSIPLGMGLLVRGEVSDDGLPAWGTPTQSWSVTAQPAGAVVAFTHASDINTGITFSLEGTYQLLFTATDGEFTAEQALRVEVTSESSGSGVPMDNLAVWLQLDETSGAVVGDASGNSRDVALTGATVWQPEGGAQGGALQFTGSAQRGEIANSAGLNNVAQMSWAFWLNPAGDITADQGILGKRTSTNNATKDWGFWFKANAGNRITFDIAGTRIEATAGIPANQWTHVAFVFDGTLDQAARMCMYVNGEFSQAMSVASTILQNNNVNVMLATFQPADDRNFIGMMDDVVIYHGRALTGEDVLQVMNGGGNLGPLVGIDPVLNAQAQEPVLLSATVTDDGLPEVPGAVTLLWEQIDGPGTAVFSDTAVLTPSVTFPVSGAYTLRLAANDGEVTTYAEIGVNVEAGGPTAPVILTQPESLTVAENDAAEFSVVVGGNPAPSYQWRKGGVDIPGADQAGYSIASATQANAGDYTVFVFNGIGDGVESAVATLTVTTPPPPAPANLTATAVAYNQIDLAWSDMSDVSDLSEAFRIERSADGSTWSTLTTVTGTSHSDTGLMGGSTWYYRVIALRDGQESDPSTAVSATTPAAPSVPVITQAPQAQTVPLGGTAVFTVVATGSPAPGYQWYVNNTLIPEATAATLEIVDVQFEDEGLYHVRVSNSEGHVESAPVWLEATVPPSGPQLFARINFQTNVAAPDGWLKDIGEAYSDRGNGFLYGWSGNNTGTSRLRNSVNSPDFQHDTLVHMQNGGIFSWEIAVPNGSYQVRIVAGDAGHFDSVFKISVEETLLVDGTPDTNNRWIEGIATVEVSDGFLNVTNAAGASNNKICFIEIHTIPEVAEGYDAWAVNLPVGQRAKTHILDGVPNLLRYAFGGDETTPASFFRLQAQASASGMTLSFPRMDDLQLTYEIWGSQDLVDWGTAPVWSGVGDGPDSLFLENPPPLWFLHLRVRHQTP
jgi:hypothetical protein